VSADPTAIPTADPTAELLALDSMSPQETDAATDPSDLPAIAPREFVHLSLHTEFSLVDSTVRIKPLARQTAATMPAVAVTDRANLFALVKFYRAALDSGIKPLVGVDLRVRAVKQDEPATRLLLLVQNDAGYLNLTRLVSRSFQEGQGDGEPTVEREWVLEAHEGLIALSGGMHGDVGLALARGKPDEARALASLWQSAFGDRYYLELTRCGRPQEEACLRGACAIAADAGIPVVATNDVRFLVEADFSAHEARLCIAGGKVLADPKRPQDVTPQQYLKSPAEMALLFADIPVALDNACEIARRCNVTLSLGTPVLPDFPIPAGLTETEYFYRLAREGLEERLGQLFDTTASDFTDIRQPYDARLQRELDVIAGMGFPGYFLIVSDFIRWSRENGVPVGPGRGSGAGSLVAYVLRITDIDPLAYDLLFERFLNPERVSMPDFDIDFCMDGRDRVIAYVAEKYGHHRVSQIITYGTMAAKAVVRDVGRIMSHPFGFVDRVAKMVPFEVGMTLTRAMQESTELAEAYRDDEEVTALLDMALALEGLSRNCGKHAGGVVIAPTALTDFTPLYCEPDGSSLVTQFDKDDAEAVGLVKFDFLGLKTLTIIDNAVGEIEKYSGTTVDLMALPLDDAPTYELLQNARTTSVFQLESAGIKRLVERLKPDNFEDIIALVALYRPGPLQSGMVDDFIDRKHGRKPLAWPHEDYQLESLKPILEPTYGVILYQEQVMGIAQTMAGFSLGTADILRRAMGKKKPEEMAKQRQGFLDGCTTNGIDVSLAGNIFDLVEKFAGYGFNKSHSAAYALLSYQTAWLKCHHPAAFMASVLSADADLTDKVVMQIEDCHALGVTIESPDINRSELRFSVVDERTILYGLGAIKGVGEGALASMLAERNAHGPFANLDDLCRRVNPGNVNKRVLEALIRAGACDELGANRATLWHDLPIAMQGGDQYHRDRAAGQGDIFDFDDAAPLDSIRSVAQVDWSEHERLDAEHNTLGLYLSGHPVDAHRAELASFTHGDLEAICAKADATDAGPSWKQRGVPVVAAGIVLNLRQTNSQGGRMLLATIDDGRGRLVVTLRGETLEACEDRVRAKELLVVEGEVSVDDFNGGFRIRAREVHDLAGARVRFSRGIRLIVDGSTLSANEVPELIELLGSHRGATPLTVEYSNAQAQARIRGGARRAVTPSNELVEALRQRFGETAVEVVY